ncbi:MAG: hypothetical protein IPL63_19790 [Saprospiraceae bacterium]|nr:hypothetical protein [Saprospiraceae bacterium]
MLNLFRIYNGVKQKEIKPEFIPRRRMGVLILPKNLPQALSLKQQIDTTDVRIDKMVYELYGLNDEEIRIVEF